MDPGLLLLRLLLAALLFGHATQKLRGWFGGAGLAGTGAVFETWGFVPGPRLALTAGLAELTGAGLLALGLLTPAGCAIVIGTMTVAVAATAPKGFWAQRGGCEVPFWYGAAALVLALTGPGSWSLDAALDLPWSGAAPGWGAVVLAAGLLAAAVPLTARARVLAMRTAGSKGSADA